MGKFEVSVLPSASVKASALELGFATVGICDAAPSAGITAYADWLANARHGTMSYLAKSSDLRADPRALLPSCRSVVAVTLNYAQPNPPVPGQPRIATYALGRDYHKVLRSKLRKLERWLQAMHPGVETRACVDSAPILERDFAHLAGLGWFGKNTLLIDSRRGSWFFIGLLLTSLHFEPDLPSMGSCGSCMRCVEACPTGAIIQENRRWQVDARHCISYLTIEHKGDIEPELAAKMGAWTFGCDVCQEVCPFNEPRASQPLRAAKASEPDFLTGRAWPGLNELAQISHEDWDGLTRGSAVRRTGLLGLRRNARINLENER